MFYYPNVLHRQSGCFSVIWLAATKGIKITRRQFLNVNVNQTCQQILDYVMCQVPPPRPSLPRPRFSLYLSSQLQYGVVVVYHRQCSFLLVELQQTLDRLLRTKNACIDMVEPERQSLEMPDILAKMEDAEAALDISFGIMDSYTLPSPRKIHLPGLLVQDSGLQHSLVSNSQSVPNEDEFTSPLAAITLTESRKFAFTTAENFAGHDLPEITAKEVDLLIEQRDYFRGDAEEHERGRELENPMSSIEQLKVTVLGTEQDSMWQMKEMFGSPMEPPLGTSSTEATPPLLSLPPVTSESRRKQADRARGYCDEEALAAPPRRPGKAGPRQLVFADVHLQISETKMKEQIENLSVETVHMSQVLLDFPSMMKHVPPAQLLSTSCRSLLHSDLQWLWRECTTLSVLPSQEEQQRGIEGEDEEEVRGTLEQDMKRRLSSVRDISSDLGLQTRDSSSTFDVIMDMSEEERSSNNMITPANKLSPQEENRLAMEPIPEENIEMPEAMSEAEICNMQSQIFVMLHSHEQVNFSSLLPPEAGRGIVASMFHKLLKMLSARRVTATQAKAYSIIIIGPASGFERTGPQRRNDNAVTF